MTTPAPAPGWYRDGSTPGVLRWFDGHGWTEATTPDPSAGPVAPVPATGRPPQTAVDPGLAGGGWSPAAAGGGSWTPDPTPFADTPAASSAGLGPQTGFGTGAGSGTGTGFGAGTGFGSGASTFGATLPTKLGQSLSSDRITSDPQFQANRLAEARRVRGTAVQLYLVALVVLALGGLTALPLGIGLLWYACAVGAIVLVARAVRDYRRAVFRGAEPFGSGTWVLLGAGLVAALVLYFAEPVVTLVALNRLAEQVRVTSSTA